MALGGRWVIVGATAVFVLSLALRWLQLRHRLTDLDDVFDSVASNNQNLSQNLDMRGWAECHVSGRSCHFTNLIVTADGGHYLFIERYGKEYTRWAGLPLAQAIGSPGNYYYIDSWTYLPRPIRPHPIESKLQRWLVAEKKRAAEKVEFIPIYLVLYEENSLFLSGVDPQIVYAPTVLFSVLWPDNFFRSIYAVLSAFTTMRYWKIDSRVMKLRCADSSLNTGTMAALKSLSFLEAAMPPRDLVFKSVVLGLSTWSLLDEAAFRIESTGFDLRKQAYTEFSALLREQAASENGPPSAILVKRHGNDRTIANENELFSKIQHNFGAELEFQHAALHNISFPQQLSLMVRCRVLVAMHGAALAHILFLPKGSCVLEIFPFGFKKTIYRNLARVMGVHYMSYQIPRPSLTSFTAEVSTSVREACVKRGEVEWYCDQSSADCRECKRFWRSQKIVVDPEEIVDRLKLVLPLNDPLYKRERYMMYMPWEQLNNQLLGFKSACALAHYSNRTLVLPPIGFWDTLKAPKNATVARRRPFHPLHYNWRPFQRYYQLSPSLPCRLAPFDAISTLVPRLDRVLYGFFGPSIDWWRQITESFYWDIAGMNWQQVHAFPWLGRAVHVPRWKIRKRILPHMTGHVVAMGSLFYFWHFDQVLDYPVRRFQDFMHSKLYLRMVLPFHSDLVDLADILLSCSRSPLKDVMFDATHIRRGDYRQKCREKGPGALTSRRAMLSCHQTGRFLISRLGLKDSSRPILFIATNGRAQIPGSGRRVIFAKDLLLRLRTSKPMTRTELQAHRKAWKTALLLDSNERAILDQLLCIKARGQFTGNFFSSFTRTIIEHRQLAHMTSDFF